VVSPQVDGMGVVVAALNVLDDKTTMTPHVLLSTVPLGGRCVLAWTAEGLVVAALTHDGTSLATAPLRRKKGTALTLTPVAPWLAGAEAASVRLELSCMEMG
jgi:hypothetical protein